MAQTQTAQHDPAVLEAAKSATYAAFLLNGWCFATWASRIPTIREAVELTPGQLGLLLVLGSAGSLLGLPLAGWLSGRYGAARTVSIGATIALTGLAVTGVTAGALHSVIATGAVLFLLCFGIGSWDVSMNLEGATVEHGLGRTIMPRYHAAFSLGSVGGAAVGAGFAAVGLPVAVHFGVTGAILLALVIVSVRRFLPRAVETHEDVATGAQSGQSTSGKPARARSAWSEPRTLVIGVVALVAAFAEGSANDWVSVALIDGYHLPEWAGVLGLATFLSFMTAGRILGTHLIDSYGRVMVLRVLFILGAVGSLLVVLGTPPLAFIGVAIWGVGVSLGFPMGMSAAADDQSRAAARISVVSTIAYSAFLIGPPTLGFIADHTGILRALTVVSVLLVAALVGVPALAAPKPKEAMQDAGATHEADPTAEVFAIRDGAAPGDVGHPTQVRGLTATAGPALE